MKVRIVCGIIGFFISLAIGVAVLASMILAINGYSESDASWGLGVFVVLSLITSLVIAFLAGAFVYVFSKRQMSLFLSVFLSLFLCVVISIFVQIIGGISGIVIAEYVRVNF